MSAINRAALAEHLWPGIIEFFGLEYSDYRSRLATSSTNADRPRRMKSTSWKVASGLRP